MSIVMAFVFGLLGGEPAALVDKHYDRITDPAELPDMTRFGPPLPNGVTGLMFRTAKYGWHPGRGDKRGAGRVAAVIARLGPPMTLVRTRGTQQGYMWRHTDPAKPHAGIMILIDERLGTIKLRDWQEFDRSPGYGGRVGVAGENEIYRWFDWLTTPLTPAEAAAAPAEAAAADLEGGHP